MKRNTRLVSAAVAAPPIVILAASVAGTAFEWPRWLFRVLCHGIPERCLELFGTPMPICARCTGIYAGMLFGLLVYLCSAAIPGGAAPPRMAVLHLLILVAPLAIDGITQAVGLRESTNLLRIATGLLAGGAFAFWVLAEVEHQETHAFTSP